MKRGVHRRLGWALALGNINGTGINAAHELGHKRDWLPRFLAIVATAFQRSSPKSG